MASEQVEADLDRLSALPFELLLHIFSFLPFKFTVRASVLARHFRLLWASSPSIDLDRRNFRQARDFVYWTDRCFARRRRRNFPIVSFALKVEEYRYNVPGEPLSLWLLAARSKGLRHLSLIIDQKNIEKILPLILSFNSLESVSIKNSWPGDLYPYSNTSSIPLKFNLIHLKSLHIEACLTCSQLTRLMSEQKNLEYLCYLPRAEMSDMVHLSSPTVKTLKLTYYTRNSNLGVKLSFPILESLDLEMRFGPYECFNVNMPLLRNARIKIPCLKEDRVSGVGDWLRSLINVEELDLSVGCLCQHVEVIQDEFGRKKTIGIPFHPLVEKGKDLPTFPNLKRLKFSMCFHELAIEDLVCLLHKSPVLQSLQLVHRANDCWISRLPVNSEGNNEHAYFDDLHVGDNKIELETKLLLQLSEINSEGNNEHAYLDDPDVDDNKTELGV